jgi:tetratricopeptide (TPR) repeat protein
MRVRKHLLILLVLGALFGLLAAGCTAKARAARRFERAERYFQAGEYDKAEIEYLVGLRRQPDEVRAIARLGLVYYEQGRFSRALGFLLRAWRLDTNNVELCLKTAHLRIGANQPQEAREAALFVLQRQPTNDEAIVLYAEAARTTNDVKEARERLARWRQTAGERAGLHLAAALLALRSKEPQKAESELERAAALDPKSVDLHLLEAALYQSRNDPTNADRALKAASDLAPVRSMARLRYVESKVKAGAAAEARALLKTILDAAPDYVPAQVQACKLALSEKQLEECEAMVKKVLGREPADFEALLMTAQLSLARGKREQAVTEMERLRALYPKSALVQYQLALAQLLNGEVAKCVGSLNQAVALDADYTDAVLLLAELNVRRGNPKAAIDSLTRLLRREPNLLLAHVRLAEAYRANGALAEALVVYRRLMGALPRNPQFPFLAGLVLREQNKLVDARKSFAQALTLAPGDLAVIQQMVEVDLAGHRFDAARELLQEPLRRQPTNSALRILLAVTHLAQTNTATAQGILEQTIQQDESARGAYLLLAQIYLGSGKHQQALERLQTVAAKGSNDLPALMMIASIQDRAGNYDAAREAYEKVLKVNSRSLAALNNLAYLYAERLNRLEEAFQLARRARDLAPADPNAADTLGWIVFKRGDYPWALTLIEEAARKQPGDPEIQYHLGMAYYMLGQEEPAQTFLRRAAQAAKDFPGKANVQRALALLLVDPAKAGPQAIPALKQAVAERPNDPVALSRLATLYERDADYQQAISVLETAVKTNPKLALFHARLAQLYAERGLDPSQALEHARTARKLDAEDPHVAHLAGRAASQAGDPVWGLTLLQEVTRQQPPDAELLNDLAFAAYAAGRASEAQAAARRAQEAEPKSPHAESARVCSEMIALASNPVQATQAVARVQTVVANRPGYAPAEMALAVALQHRGDLNGARQAYARILARNAGFAPALRGLALLGAEQGNQDQETYAAASKAQMSYPDDPDLGRAMGVLAYRRGDYAKASRSLRQCVQVRTNDAEAHFYLGMVQYRLDQRQLSKASLQKAVALPLNSALAQEATRVLAELK